MTTTTKKVIKKPAENQQPNMGALLKERILEHGMTYAEVARKMGATSPGISKYLQHSSLQGSVLWKAGLAIGHNFFAELGRAFPIPFPDKETEAQLQEKDARITELEKELAIYKSIVMSGK